MPIHGRQQQPPTAPCPPPPQAQPGSYATALLASVWAIPILAAIITAIAYIRQQPAWLALAIGPGGSIVVASSSGLPWPGPYAT